MALTEAHRAQMVTVANAASEGASPLMLRIEGVTQARSGQFYQLFVNLPSGMSPDPAGVHFVGNLVMFGHVHDGAHIHTGASFLYDISELVRTLEASGAFTGDLALTFVPQIPGSPAGTYMEFDHVSIGNLI